MDEYPPSAPSVYELVNRVCISSQTCRQHRGLKFRRLIQQNSLVDRIHRSGVVVIGGAAEVAVAVVEKRLSLHMQPDHVTKLADRPALAARSGGTACGDRSRDRSDAGSGGPVRLHKGIIINLCSR